METELQEIPEEGEVVIATVNEITPHGVYVSLDEYRNRRGFLHISEISTGWVRNIDRYVRKGQKVVLKVIRVRRARGEVDLSLRQVGGDERKHKLIEVKKAEKAKSIFEIVRSRLNLGVDEAKKLKDMLSQEYGALYDAIEEVARKGGKALGKLNLPAEYVTILEQVAKEKVIIPTVEVSGVMRIISELPDGVEVVRRALRETESVKIGGATVKVSYIGSPRYRIVVSAENYKVAEKVLQSAIEKAQEVIVKSKGEFSFSRGEARKSGE